ncbi:MAG: hypothetical protein ACJA2C_002857 [Marinoscillum sp.]|jgi:hypothetical protein
MKEFYHVEILTKKTTTFKPHALNQNLMYLIIQIAGCIIAGIGLSVFIDHKAKDKIWLAGIAIPFMFLVIVFFAKYTQTTYEIGSNQAIAQTLGSMVGYIIGAVGFAVTYIKEQMKKMGSGKEKVNN